MKKFLAIATVFLLLSGCGEKSKETNTTSSKSSSSLVCKEDTPLAKMGNTTITLAYYNEVKKFIPTKVLEQYYGGKEGKEKLLNKIVDRQVILLYEKDKGLFEEPKVKSWLDSFKKRQLANRYINLHLGNYKVSEPELEKYIKEHYKGKKISPMERQFIKANLEAQKFERSRKELLNKIGSEIKISGFNVKDLKDDTLIGEFKGRSIYYKDVKPFVRGKLSEDTIKKAATLYAAYLLATDSDVDKDVSYRALLNTVMEDKAISAFTDELSSKVSVSDKEIKEYYDKHKNEMKMPAQAEVVIYEFKNKEEAKKSLKLLNEGKPLPKEVLKTGKRWKVLSSDVGMNPVATLVFKENKDKSVVEMPNGLVLLVVVERRIPSKVVPYGDAYGTIKRHLTNEKMKKLAEEKIKELREKYGVKLFRENLNCLM